MWFFNIKKSSPTQKRWKGCQKKLNKLPHNKRFLIDILFNQERKSRMVFIEKIKTKDPMKLNSKVYQLIKRNNLYVKSITIDNGIEFSKIDLLAKWIKCHVYFCEPCVSYQRGMNEHVNGIIRRFWKKNRFFTIIM